MCPFTSSTVRLCSSRTCEHGERRGQDTFAKCRVAALGFDVHDDVDPRKRVVQRVLDAVRRGVPLTDGRPRRDADDDVREALSSRSA